MHWCSDEMVAPPGPTFNQVGSHRRSQGASQSAIATICAKSRITHRSPRDDGSRLTRHKGGHEVVDLKMGTELVCACAFVAPSISARCWFLPPNRVLR